MSGPRPPAPILHDLRVTLASDARIDTLLDQVATLIDQGAAAGLRVETAINVLAALRGDSDDQQHLLRRLVHMEKEVMVKLADLQGAVSRLEESQAAHVQVTQQAVELIRTQHSDNAEIKAMLVELQDNGTDADLAAVIARIDQAQANTQAEFGNLAAAIAEVIPNEPAPEPLPPAEPVPEPAPVEPAPVEPAPPVEEPAPVEPGPVEPAPEVPAEPVPPTEEPAPVEPTPEPEPAPAEPPPEPPVDPNAGNG